MDLDSKDEFQKIIPTNLQEYLQEYPKITQGDSKNDHKAQFRMNSPNPKQLG